MNMSGVRYSFKGTTLLGFLNLKNSAIVVVNDKKINTNTKIWLVRLFTVICHNILTINRILTIVKNELYTIISVSLLQE